jgi:hypothetical protein
MISHLLEDEAVSAAEDRETGSWFQPITLYRDEPANGFDVVRRFIKQIDRRPH